MDVDVAEHLDGGFYIFIAKSICVRLCVCVRGERRIERMLIGNMLQQCSQQSCYY